MRVFSNRTIRGLPSQLWAKQSSLHSTHFQPRCHMFCLNRLISPNVLLGKCLTSGSSMISAMASAIAAAKDGVDCMTLTCHDPSFRILRATVPRGRTGFATSGFLNGLGAGATGEAIGSAVTTLGTGFGSGTTGSAITTIGTGFGSGTTGSATTTTGTGVGSGTVPFPTRPKAFPMSTQRFQKEEIQDHQICDCKLFRVLFCWKDVTT